MTREHHDWITGFLEYTKFGEAPPKLYFWVGVATIAAALRRRVWIDMAYFKWYPNLYTLIVAPPGVVAKSTTASLGMDLLRRVPGIHFGPDVVTWQALFDALTEVHESFEYSGDLLEMSALCISASEFGNFLDPRDTQMVDQLVNLWDGQPVKKRTRGDGEQVIHNPCLNVIGCTTPSWIAQHFPEYMIGGGLTSRMIFVYAEQKARFNAYPYRNVPADFRERGGALVRDLERIALLQGPMQLTPEAEEWGAQWYEHFHKIEARQIDETILGGYINRKQTMVHKLAMCLSASQGDSLVITQPLLERAVGLVTELEREMPKVYSRVGQSTEAMAGDKIMAYIARCGGKAPYPAVFAYVHRIFANTTEFESTVAVLIKAGRLKVHEGNPLVLEIME